MWKFLAFISRNLVLAIPAAMALGLAHGLLFPAGPLKALIVPLTLLMVLPMMVTLDLRKLLEGGDLKAQALAQAVNFGVLPFLALALGRAFFPDAPALVLGLLLAGLVPTSGMTISWTGLARGNVAAAVKMTVLGLTLGSLLTPFYVKAMLGADISVDMAAVTAQIGLVVFAPMAAGHLLRRWLVGRYGQPAFRQHLAPRMPALSCLGVLGIVYVALALKARDVAADPATLLAVLPPLLLLYAVNFGLGALLGRLFLPRGEAIALVYGTVMRNLSIALAIAINAFGAQGSSAAMVIALAYVIQVQSAAWFVRFTDRVFGPAEPAPRPILAEEGGRP
jgi:ACR3 family arsenite efflux pump ArsB